MKLAPYAGYDPSDRAPNGWARPRPKQIRRTSLEDKIFSDQRSALTLREIAARHRSNLGWLRQIILTDLSGHSRIA